MLSAPENQLIATKTLPCSMYQCLSISHHLLNTIPGAIWSALQESDPALPALPARGVGELKGSMLTVRWARDTSERFFSIEVLDESKQEVWESAAAEVGTEEALTFWRRVMGQGEHPPAAWSKAVAHEPGLRPYLLKSKPSFLSMAAAFLSQEVPLVLEDLSVTEQLEDDLAYWRGLAKTQAKTIKRLEKRYEMQYAVEASEAPSSAKEEPIRVWRLDEMDEWASLNEDRIVILPRALASARRSPYEKPEAVYEALELLAHTYRLTKLAQLDRHELKAHADRLNLTIGGSVDKSNAGEAGDEYYFRWSGRRRFMDQHLGKGSARDPRFALRIYFTWDDDLEKVIVGWLPSHLSTGRS